MSDLASSNTVSSTKAGPSVKNLDIVKNHSKKQPTEQKAANPANQQNTDSFKTRRNQQVTEKQTNLSLVKNQQVTEQKQESPVRIHAGDSFKSANTNPVTPTQTAPATLKTVRPLPFMASVNAMQTDSLNQITNFISRFMNIMDKISAVFGEREKDVRDKLSDTFKRQVVKEYTPFEKVDASMEQKDHHQEKKTRDPEEERAKERVD